MDLLYKSDMKEKKPQKTMDTHQMEWVIRNI